MHFNTRITEQNTLRTHLHPTRRMNNLAKLTERSTHAASHAHAANHKTANSADGAHLQRYHSRKLSFHHQMLPKWIADSAGRSFLSFVTSLCITRDLRKSRCHSHRCFRDASMRDLDARKKCICVFRGFKLHQRQRSAVSHTDLTRCNSYGDRFRCRV